MKLSRSITILGLFFLTLILVSFTWIRSGPKINGLEMPSPTPAVDQEAVDLLQGALDYLSKQNLFSVKAQSTMEDLLDSGHRVDLEISSSEVVSRPNKMHIERHGAHFGQIFFYNGEVLTLFNPSDKVYATESAPGTIEDMFHYARDTYGIFVPVSGLLYGNSFKLLMQDVSYGAIISKEMIGEVQCDHLLFSRPGVDFQIWIADSGPP